MSETLPALDAGEVARWLEEHPDFLGAHPQLALRLVIPRQDGAAASLAGYQLEQLRQRVSELETHLATLRANAQTNESLAAQTHALCLALMAQTTPGDTVRTMVETLARDFSGDHVALVLHAPLADGFQADWLRILAPGDPRLAALPAELLAGSVVCGRLPAVHSALLPAEQADRIQSMAVVPLCGLGLLVIGSADPHHFWPGMGTVFLDMMGQSLNAALSRFR